MYWILYTQTYKHTYTCKAEKKTDTHTQKYRQTKRDRDGCIERERQKVRKTNKKTGR